MNVLLVSEHFPPAWSAGGTVVSAWNLARSLSEAGARVHVVTTDAHTGPRGRIPRRRVEAGLTIDTARVLRTVGTRAHRFGIAPGIVGDLLRASRDADVCVMQGLWTLPAAAASRICHGRGVPYVLSAQGALEEGALRQKALKKRVYRRLVASATIRRAAGVHFASERERDRSLGAIGAVRAIVIPNAFETRPLVSARRAELCAGLGLSEESLLIVMAGRVHPVKGFDTLVPALGRADARVHLLIAGSDHERNLPGILDLAGACGARGRIHPLGHLEPGELDDLYASIDVLVLPSHGETFGNVVIEALRQGTPVLISDQVPLAPYVEAHGLGVVAPAHDADAWARALDRWVASPVRLDRASTAGRIARDFSLEVLAGRWMEVLSSLARRDGRRGA